MLVVDSVNKSYGKKQVLFDLSFTFERGVYGLLGPNGAGKSTLLQIMTGNLKCEKGQVLYKGKDIRRFSKPIFMIWGMCLRCRACMRCSQRFNSFPIWRH